MPLERYPQAGFELLDDRVPIWRFMKMKTFKRFIQSNSIYFCRADLFEDEHEGLPLEEFVRDTVAAMGPEHSFDSTWQNLKDERQGSFISCWTLDETVHMWEKFAPEGVAVASLCGLLKASLDAMPARTMVGHVRYGLKHEGFNILRFITTKRPEFAPEQEVRALVWDLEQCPTNPYPHIMPNGLSFSVDIKELVQSIIVSPHAPVGVFDEVDALMRANGYKIPISKSGFTGYGHLLPTADQICLYSKR